MTMPLTNVEQTPIYDELEAEMPIQDVLDARPWDPDDAKLRFYADWLTDPRVSAEDLEARRAHVPEGMLVRLNGEPVDELHAEISRDMAERWDD